MHLYSLCQTWLNLKTHTGAGGGGVAYKNRGRLHPAPLATAGTNFLSPPPPPQ